MDRLQAPKFEVLDGHITHSFELPSKKINEGSDLPTFLSSLAYRDLTLFLSQLNYAMFPEVIGEGSADREKVIKTYELTSQVSFSSPIIQLQSLIKDLDKIVGEVPPDEGPRRFGNISFRKWYELLEQRAPTLLDQFLPQSIRSLKQTGDVSALSELQAYFMGSFGSPQRLDYGTGHELSFLAFLGGIWKLGGFDVTKAGEVERELVLGVIQP